MILYHQKTSFYMALDNSARHSSGGHDLPACGMQGPTLGCLAAAPLAEPAAGSLMVHALLLLHQLPSSERSRPEHQHKKQSKGDEALATKVVSGAVAAGTLMAWRRGDCHVCVDIGKSIEAEEA
jgi:hypothetical protein